MKKQTIAAVAAAAGACIFTGAAFASYGTANGYGALKNALWGVAEAKNYTAQTEIEMTLDAEFVESGNAFYEFDGETKRSHLITYSSSDDFKSEEWRDGGTAVSRYNTGENREVCQVLENVGEVEDNFLKSMNSDEDTGRKLLRFVEVLADTVVGDLKNNFSYMGEENGKTRYDVSLTSVQIPEVINTGLAAVFALNNSNSDSDLQVGDVPEDETAQDVLNCITDAYLDSLDGSFSLNGDNTLDSGNAELCFRVVDKYGRGHDLTVGIKLDMSGYGTTAPEMIDIENYEGEIIYPEYRYQEDTEVTVK